MNYSLWIDDRRNPRHYLNKETGGILLWARDGEQAAFYISRHGLPVHLYIDFDLGDRNVIPLLHWMSKEYPRAKLDYTIISSNPDGRKDIAAFMKAWIGR